MELKRLHSGCKRHIILVGSHSTFSHLTWAMPWYLQPLTTFLTVALGAPPHLEVYVLQEVEVLGIHPKVLQEEAVGQVIGKILWEGEVAEAGHLLGAVGDG